MCIAIDSDLLFPVSEMEYIAQHISEARLEIISSIFGHDGFLLEHAQISDKIDKIIGL